MRGLSRPPTLPVPQAHPYVVARRPMVLPTAVETPRALPVEVVAASEPAPAVPATWTERTWPPRRSLPEGYASSIRHIEITPKRPYIEVAENPIGTVVVRVPDCFRSGEAQDILESFHRMPIAEMPRRAWQWRHYRNKYEHWGHSIPDYSTRRKVEASLAAAKKLTAPIYPLKPEHEIGHLIEAHTVIARKTGNGLVGGGKYLVEAAVCREVDTVEVFGKQRRRARNVLELRLVPYAPAPDPDKDTVNAPPPPVYTWREGRDSPKALLEAIVMPHVDDISVCQPKALRLARAAVAAIEAESGFTLFDWQREDVARAVVAERCLVAWAMGLGKTSCSLFIALARVRLGAPNLALFVVPQDLIEQWQGEARERFDLDLIHIESPAAVAAHEENVRLGYTRRDAPKPMTPRQARDFIKHGGRGFFITHYEALSRAGRVFEESVPGAATPVPVRTVGYQKLSAARHLADAIAAPIAPDVEIAKSGYTHLKNAFRDGIIVIDEATKIKATESDRGRAIRALKAQRRYVLTGTPVKNRLEDIFWLLQWVGGGKRFPYSVAEGPAAFLNDFGVRESLKAPSGATKAGWCPDAGNLHLLRRLLAPLMIRRTAAEILSSKLTYRIVPAFVPFGIEQRKAYQAWLNSDRFGQWWQTKHKLLDPITLAIAQLSHLEYASTCPEADAAREYYEAHEQPSNWTPKALRALEEVYKAVLAGERVLFGSITLGLVAWVTERLREAGVEVVSLIRPKKNESGYSSLLPSERAAMIRDFATGKAQVLATGMRAMALGHNLDMITTVVTAGLPWEHDVYEQYLARARRLSSVKPVTMHVIMTDGSLDQRKWELLQQKRATSSLVVDAVELVDDTVSIDYQAILAELQARGVATDEAVVDERSCAATWAETVRRGIVQQAAAPARAIEKLSANMRATLQVSAALTSGYPVLAWEGHRAELSADGRFCCYRRGVPYPLISGWAYDAAKAFVDLVGAAAAHRALRLARMGPEQGREFLEWWKHGAHTWESPRADWWRFGSHTWMSEVGGSDGA